jgi:hypothetical protein
MNPFRASEPESRRLSLLTLLAVAVATACQRRTRGRVSGSAARGLEGGLHVGSYFYRF